MGNPYRGCIPERNTDVDCFDAGQCEINRYGYCQAFSKFSKERFLSLLKKKGIPEEDYNDLFQDFFCRVSQSIKNLRSSKSITSFLYSIAYNTITDYIARNLSKRKESLDTAVLFKDNELQEHPNILSASKSSYEEETRQAEIQETAQHIIMILKEMAREGEECAEFILLFYRGLKRGLSQKEMAKELGLKPNTFNQRLKRCRERLRRKLLMLM